MSLHTLAHIKGLLEAALAKGEALEEFCYALKSFKGHAIGLAPTRLIFIELSLFGGKPKNTWDIARADIADAHYDEKALIINAKDGAEHKFMMTGTAGLEGGENFDHARALYKALTK